MQPYFPTHPELILGVAAALGNDLVGDALGDLHIAVGLHGVLAAALSGRTQVGGIAKHIGQRDQRVDLHGAGTALLTLDLTAAAVQVADDITQVLVGDDDGDLQGVALRQASLKAMEPAILKAISEESTSW